MPIGEGRTVWILGAGFSQSLGGPLLVDLFRQRLYEDLQGTLGTQRAARLSWTQALYNFGHDHKLWEDAEDFLVYMEAARGNPANPLKSAQIAGLLARRDFLVAATTIAGVRTGSDFAACLNNPLAAVLHALGTETSEFLKHNPVDLEPWRPYFAWAKLLNPETDSIITFNYDTILETIELEFQQLNQSRLQIVLPKEKVEATRVPVFKLHGSADWTRGGDNVVRDTQAVENGSELAIAAPGRSKADLTSTLLKPLWEHARYRLKHAAVVVIVGYGFPKTDAQARMELLDALEEDNSGVRVRQVHLVLGPDINLPTHRRVLELVRHRLGRPRIPFTDEIPQQYSASNQRLAVVVRHPLWAQDFIGDYVSRTVNLPLKR